MNEEEYERVRREIEEEKKRILAEIKISQRDRAYLAEHIDERVIQIFESRFLTNLPCFQSKDGRYDPLDAMRRDAYREVVLWLRWSIEQHKQEHNEDDD